MKFIIRAMALSALLAASACAQNETESTKAPISPAAPTVPTAAAASAKVGSTRVNVANDSRTGNVVISDGQTMTIRPREAAPVKKEKGSYLGVSVSPASAALRYQIGLTPGFGLVVDSVEPASPAEEAGLKRFDILSKFDDQQLINADQFLVLVRSKSPGEALTLSVIREGKTVTLNTKTVEKDVTPLTDAFSYSKGTIFLGQGTPAQQYEATLNAARGMIRDSRDKNAWSTYAKKQISDDVSGQTWTFSWEGEGQLLRADYTESGQKKIFMYRFDQPDKATLPDSVKKALDAYLARKKTTVDDIYKSIAPGKADPFTISTPAAPGI